MVAFAGVELEFGEGDGERGVFLVELHFCALWPWPSISRELKRLDEYEKSRLNKDMGDRRKKSKCLNLVRHSSNSEVSHRAPRLAYSLHISEVATCGSVRCDVVGNGYRPCGSDISTRSTPRGCITDRTFSGRGEEQPIPGKARRREGVGTTVTSLSLVLFVLCGTCRLII